MKCEINFQCITIVRRMKQLQESRIATIKVMITILNLPSTKWHLNIVTYTLLDDKKCIYICVSDSGFAMIACLQKATASFIVGFNQMYIQICNLCVIIMQTADLFNVQELC